MKLINVIELIRDVANAHPDIESFHTGLPSERDTRADDFPALRINFPYVYSPVMDDNGESNRANITLDLELFVSTSEECDDDSHEIESNYSTQDPTYNEIDKDLVEEVLQREFALSIMSHVVHAIRNYSNECGSFYQIETSQFTSLERETTNMVTGIGCQMTFNVYDEYRCETENFVVIGGTPELPYVCPELPAPLRYSMDYNGVDRYGTISQATNNTFDLDWQQPLTFETWYFHVPGQTMYFYGKMNTSAGYFFSSVGSRDEVRFQIRNTSPFQIIDINSQLKLSAGWNHVIVNWNGGGNAEYDCTVTINTVESPKPNNWSQGLQLTAGTTSTTALAETGRLGSFNAYGIGTVAHMRLWKNVELTSTEIQTLYNGGKVLYDDVPQSNSLLFDTGFADENHGWYGSTGWVMQELSGNSNSIFGRNSSIVDRNKNVPS